MQYCLIVNTCASGGLHASFIVGSHVIHDMCERLIVNNMVQKVAFIGLFTIFICDGDKIIMETRI